MIETTGDFSCQLNMWGLIFAHRDTIGFIHQDVGSLEHRIAQESISIDVFLIQLVKLLLIGGIPLQPG